MVRRHENNVVCLVQQNKDDKDDRDLRAAYRYTRGGKTKTELKQRTILSECKLAVNTFNLGIRGSFPSIRKRRPEEAFSQVSMGK